MTQDVLFSKKLKQEFIIKTRKNACQQGQRNKLASAAFFLTPLAEIISCVKLNMFNDLKQEWWKSSCWAWVKAGAGLASVSLERCDLLWHSCIYWGAGEQHVCQQRCFWTGHERETAHCTTADIPAFSFVCVCLCNFLSHDEVALLCFALL